MNIKKVISRVKWSLIIWNKFKVRKKNEGLIVFLATPIHGNLGDQAIVYAEKKLISDFYKGKTTVEIPNGCYLAYPGIINRFIHKEDIIIIDGGGNMGTLWKHEDDKIRLIIETYKENKILVFPQTCYYDDCDNAKRIETNRIAYENAEDLTVMLRDKASFELFNKLFPNTKTLFVPDIVLSLQPDMPKKERKGILLCLREDCEKTVDLQAKSNLLTCLGEFSNFSTLVPYNVNEKNRLSELYKKWDQLSGAELLICDRLHAMIFALITKTPCIALDNVSKKVSGTYSWIQNSPYIRMVNSVDEIPGVMAEMNTHTNNNDFKYPYELLDGIRS